ncbi:arylesterase [Gilvimarinus algae]|uniref:Arylesterase n=1 Tax=Gilvimarinus algae TaxID=3058037 RepID=A0ABT8TLG2_9GAMM|nr:arylesterase [Gilvimarinus sp. SDUM040014]MDO3383938.1 arylesterase [Gilvimarinus sp. SDUM040014]
MLALLFALQAMAEPGRILVMGDSLSAGYGIDLEQGWANLLQEKLRDQGYEQRVINASVSGETTTGGRARLEKLLTTHSPTLVILELGGNDGLRGQPIKIMQSNLAAMIETAKSHEAQVLLVGIQIPPNYGARYADAFSDVFPALADEYELALVPFLLEGVALDNNLMQNDGIHPKAEAQPILLDNVWRVLEPMLAQSGSK